MTREQQAAERPSDVADRPLLTIDLDGVICAPILGLNYGIQRAFLDAETAPSPARVWPRALGDVLDRVRFDLRRPLPEARPALEHLAEVRRLAVLTGRRSEPLRWLRRHGMDRYFDRIVINEGALKSPHYKLRAVRELGAAEHIDDDPRTAQLLAQASDVRVYLRDWPRNRDLAFDPNVTRVPDLQALATLLLAGNGHGEPQRDRIRK